MLWVPDVLVFFSGLGFGGVGGVGGLATSRSPPPALRRFILGSMTSETFLCWLSCVLVWLAALRRSGCRLGPPLVSALSGWLAEDLEDVWRVSRRVCIRWFVAVVLT